MTYEAEWKISQEDDFILNSLLSALSSPLLLIHAFSFLPSRILSLTFFILSVSISRVLYIHFLVFVKCLICKYFCKALKILIVSFLSQIIYMNLYPDLHGAVSEVSRG